MVRFCSEKPRNPEYTTAKLCLSFSENVLQKEIGIIMNKGCVNLWLLKGMTPVAPRTAKIK